MNEFEKDFKFVMTETLRQRFCKDMNLSIKIFEDPYFANFLKLYDEQYGAVAKYNRFVSAVMQFGCEQDYFEAYNKLKDEVIEYLNNNPEMAFFAKEEDMSKFVCQNKGYPTNDIFKETNDGKVFVSIDMVKGNFTALHHYNPSIVKNCDTYEDFIHTFTDVPHFVESKYIRQVVFGNVNPKRQVTYEKYLMDMVLTKLLETGVVKPENVEFFSTDEIVLSVPDEMLCDSMVNEEFYNSVMNVVKWAKENNINVRGEFFELRKIPGTSGYVKKFMMGKDGVDFKCLDFLTMPFVLRAYQKEEPNDMDRVFLYEGKKVMLLEDIKVEVV